MLYHVIKPITKFIIGFKSFESLNEIRALRIKIAFLLFSSFLLLLNQNLLQMNLITLWLHYFPYLLRRFHYYSHPHFPQLPGPRSL